MSKEQVLVSKPPEQKTLRVDWLPNYVFSWGPLRVEPPLRVVDMKAAMAESLAMTIFVIIGCGTACGNGAFDGATRLLVAFAFGMSIMVLAYTVAKHSGGQINGAVTFSLVLGGIIPWWQGLANFIAQTCGSIIGAGFLVALFPCEHDLTTNLGTNLISQDYFHPTYGSGPAFAGEFIGTAILCFVVWETAVSPRSTSGNNACIAIGFAVFIIHLLLLPIDGCSINPTRSMGPAFVSAMRKCPNTAPHGLRDLWCFIVGPMLGALFATIVQWLFFDGTRPALSR